MKTKRTLFSLVVFLSVFGISILINYNALKEADNHSQKESNNDRLSVYSNLYGNVTSKSNRLYLYEDTDTDSQIDQNPKGIDGSCSNVLVNESFITIPPAYKDLQGGQYESIDYSAYEGMSTINTMHIKSMVIDDSLSASAETESDTREIKVKVEPESETEQGLETEQELYTEPGLDVEPESEAEQEAGVKSDLSAYSDIGISVAKSYVNIRSKATTDSDINGKLYKDSAARILDSVGDWYYVESGSVKGYVNKSFLKTGLADDELIETYGKLRILVNTDGLNVREKPSIDSKKLTVIYQKEYYPVMELQDDWIKIDVADDKAIGYVNSQYVELLVTFENAISKEEEEELRKLQEEEEKELKKQQEEERIKKETDVKYRDEVDYTQDELKLLACLVHAEAGNQSYKGKLAVANVVLNRVKSRKYPNSIKKVIYQSGQFSVASSGSLAKQLKKYSDYTSKSQQQTIKAAKVALTGTNNIGDRLYFNGYKAAVKNGYDKRKTSVKIEDHLFW